jgi:hypothetical protein
MGSVRVFACLALAVATAGCQPLYGNKAESLHKQEKHKRPPEAEVGPVEIKYVDECPNNFHDPAKRDTERQTGMAATLVNDGDTALANAEKAKDPPSAAALIKDSIDKYINALKRDPYSADATLKLAIAYDRVYRKGCALAMLHRLQSMMKNPKYGKAADALADQINDNAAWFKGYRKEAIAAAGR